MDDTRAYIEAQQANSVSGTEYVETSRGRYGGTWAHPKLAVIFARWLDVKFSVWCDTVISDILSGTITKPQESAMFNPSSDTADALRKTSKSDGLEPAPCGRQCGVHRGAQFCEFHGNRRGLPGSLRLHLGNVNHRNSGEYADAKTRYVEPSRVVTGPLLARLAPDMADQLAPLQQFEYLPGMNHRVLQRDDEPWFVAKDVCAALEVGNSSQAIAALDPTEKGLITTETLRGGAQRVAVISESGLYLLVLKSHKAEAKMFQKWVTGEVLGGWTLQIARDEAFPTGDPASPWARPPNRFFYRDAEHTLCTQVATRVLQRLASAPFILFISIGPA